MSPPREHAIILSSELLWRKGTVLSADIVSLMLGVYGRIIVVPNEVSVAVVDSTPTATFS